MGPSSDLVVLADFKQGPLAPDDGPPACPPASSDSRSSCLRDKRPEGNAAALDEGARTAVSEV